MGKTTKTAELQTAELVELAEPTEPREMTVFTDNYLSNFSPADWSRVIVDNGTDHGNEVMVAQFVFSSHRRFSTKSQRPGGRQKLSMLL